MDWKSVTKLVAGSVASMSVGVVVNNIIKSSTPADLTKLNRVMITVGGFVLVSMICDSAVHYVVNEIENSWPKPQIDETPKG